MIPPAPPPFGPLLARLRRSRGWSQLRLAAELCLASGAVTLTRHEISRWERQQRLPGPFWLGWLAAVLEVPVERLAAAACAARAGTPPGEPGAAGPGREPGRRSGPANRPVHRRRCARRVGRTPRAGATD